MVSMVTAYHHGYTLIAMATLWLSPLLQLWAHEGTCHRLSNPGLGVCRLAGGNATSLLQSVSSPQSSLSFPLCLA